MIKTKTVETREEFDAGGHLVIRTVTETEETDDRPAQYTSTLTPYCPVGPIGTREFYYSADPLFTCKNDAT